MNWASSDNVGPMRKLPFETRWRLDPITGCHVWTGGTTKGYAQCRRLDGKNGYGHRHAWELAHGAIPEGAHVLHRCDNPLCVNVAHLFLGTNADNMRDKTAKGRQLRGEAHPSSKLTAAQVADIRAAKGETQNSLAARFGVSQSLICMIRQGAVWAHEEKGGYSN